MRAKLFILMQYCFPQHFMSRVSGKFAASKNTFIKSTFISLFSKKFGISLEEAERSNFSDYESFNDFFCRSLKADARPISTEQDAIVSPADGCFSQLGRIEGGRVFQAKGQDFSAAEILADKELATQFTDGEFATIYLSPKDYHRVHMPIKGRLISTRFVPGDLFSVNATTAENVPRLFARNERVVCLFETELGPVAMILVGAMIVASIETVWAGELAPSKPRTIRNVSHEGNIELAMGEEMGRFKLGSTVVLLFPKDRLKWTAECEANAPVKMGEKIATIIIP